MANKTQEQLQAELDALYAKDQKMKLSDPGYKENRQQIGRALKEMAASWAPVAQTDDQIVAEFSQPDLSYLNAMRGKVRAA